MSPTLRRWLLLSFLVALFGLEFAALWALYWGDSPKALVGDEGMYLAWARSLLGEAPAPPAWHVWPPLQAWLIAATFTLFGTQLPAVQLLQTAMLLASTLLLRSIWRKVDGRVRAANVAAALFVLNPSTLAYAFYLWPEPIHLLLLLAALSLLRVAERPRIAAGAAGIALGFALLAKNLLIPFIPFFAMFAMRRERRRFDVAAIALLAAGVLVAIAPSLWRGYEDTGRPVIADSSAFNLVGGLKDRWRSDYVGDSVGPLFGEYIAAGATPQERNAVFLERAREEVDARGAGTLLADQLGRQYFRLFNHKTLLLSQLPGPACAGYLGSYAAAPPTLVGALGAFADAMHALTLVGFAVGLAFWRRWREPLVWWFLLFLGYQLALYLPLHVKARFLLPLVPFFCAFAGSAIASVRRRDPGAAVAWTDARGRGAIAIGLATLLLVLAFAGAWLDQSCR